MFGATVLVPVLFHINPATVLLFNGIVIYCISLFVKVKFRSYPRFKLCIHFPSSAAAAARV